MELSAVLAVLRRWSLTLIASAIVAGAVAYVVASRVPPTYASEAQILVGPVNTDENTLGASQELVQTYGELITTDRILGAVITALDLDVEPTALRETVTVRANSIPRLISVRALAGSPETAAAIANEIVAALDAIASEQQVRPEGEVTVVTEATPNEEPVQPQVSLIVVLAVAAGLVASLAAVLLIDYFSNTVNGRQDLQQLAMAPFLGSITPRRRFRPRPERPLVVEEDPDSTAALAYRLIASRVSAGDPGGSLRRVVVLAAEGHEASGEVAANIAAVLARGGLRVRLVDANDESRDVTRLFGIEAKHGLGDIARGDAAVFSEMIHRAHPGMDVVPRVAGRDPRMQEVERLRASLDRLGKDADILIINTAPIHRSASALLWARDADAAILVARRDKTKRDHVSFSAETLRVIGTPILGSVFHARSRRSARDERLAVERDAEADGRPRSAIGPRDASGTPERPGKPRPNVR